MTTPNTKPKTPFATAEEPMSTSTCQKHGGPKHAIIDLPKRISEQNKDENKSINISSITLFDSPPNTQDLVRSYNRQPFQANKECCQHSAALSKSPEDFFFQFPFLSHNEVKEHEIFCCTEHSCCARKDLRNRRYELQSAIAEVIIAIKETLQ